MYVPSLSKSNFYIKDSLIPQCKIYTTKNFHLNEKCLMLIQGTGNVRAGLWARSVCINEDINHGSMYPYIEKALQNNFSVIILNPNERYGFGTQKKKRIQELPSMESHRLYVYHNIIQKSQDINSIYIVAHSRGGECTIQILKNNENDLLNGKIKKIAFTDSVHGSSYLHLSKEGQAKLREIGRDYIACSYSLGQAIVESKYNNGVNKYSSGHSKHEYTSGYAIEEIFKFFNE